MMAIAESQYPAGELLMFRNALSVLITLICLFALSCQSSPERTEQSERPDAGGDVGVATFAGGCFWCMQPPFDRLDGVESTVVGYTGGEEQNPVYEEVAYGQTGHVEAIEIRFDPAVVSYEELLDVFWRSIDPTDEGGQFADRGHQYSTAIFYHDESQRQLAEASRDDLEANGPFEDPIVTPIVEAQVFWVAEEYHQKYYEKNPEHYQQYYRGSGRAGFLEETWGGE